MRAGPCDKNQPAVAVAHDPGGLVTAHQPLGINVLTHGRTDTVRYLVALISLWILSIVETVKAVTHAEHTDE